MPSSASEASQDGKDGSSTSSSDQGTIGPHGVGWEMGFTVIRCSG